MDFKFLPVSAPSESLAAVGYDETELEVIDHLGQLTAALQRGEIGFEWYPAMVREELARVGW